LNRRQDRAHGREARPHAAGALVVLELAFVALMGAALACAHGSEGQGSVSAGALDMVTRRFTERDRNLRYAIEVTAPRLEGDSPAVATFNEAVDSIVTRETGEFKELFAEGRPAECFGPPPSECRYDYSMDFTAYRSDARVVSVRLKSVSYTGGAHPNGWYTSISVDPRSGRRLDLSDLFKQDADYVCRLSDFSTSLLMRELEEFRDDRWIADGAGPKPENFRTFNLTDDHLLITFQAYQVAAGAAGPREVRVPYAALDTILRADGPLGDRRGSAAS
jgi:hypothetical protein